MADHSGPNGTQVRYHFLWCTKFCRPVLDRPVEERLQVLVKEVVVQDIGGCVIDLQIKDQSRVSLTLESPTDLSPDQIMYRVKRFTAHHLRREFDSLTTRLPSLWTRRQLISTDEIAPGEEDSFVGAQPKSTAGI